MEENITIVIKAEKNGEINYSVDRPVFTRDLVGIFEMCKLMALDNRKTLVDAKSDIDKPVDIRRQIIKATRCILLENEPLSRRVKNSLHSIEIDSLEDLLRCTVRTIKRVRNVGKDALSEIQCYVENKGYDFGTLEPIWIPTGRCATKLSNDTNYKSFRSGEECEEYRYEQNLIIRKREELL